MLNIESYKSQLITGLFILLALFYGCSGESPIVEEQEKEKKETPTIYSIAVKDGESDMPPGGGVILSQYADLVPGYYVEKIVDRNPESKYVVPHKAFHVLWTGNKKSLVNQYALTAASDSPESDPSSWALYASNDKAEWVLIDEQNNQIFSARGEVKTFQVDNSTEYKYYKLEIRDNSGEASTQIAEWAMSVYSLSISDGASNMPPGGGIITPQYPFSSTGYDVSKMVDGRPETKYVISHTAFYILWTCNESALVNQYSLTSSDDSPESDPASWAFYGSNDEKQWTLLDEQSDQHFSKRGEEKEFHIINYTEFAHFKIDILNNRGAATTQIAEWTMAETFNDIDELMDHASSFTYSSHTPMGKHYANRHVTTDDDRLWLLDPANEPPAPASVSHLSLSEFPVTLYPYGKPLPADVNQHAIGNCGGVAALASLAYQYPEFITSLIKDNGDNTYIVTMFDPQGQPVEVSVTNRFLSGTGQNIDAVSGKNNRATWATILEKAIMKYNCIFKVNPDIGGIGSEHVLPLFTGDGNSFGFYPGDLTGKQLARAVKVSLMNGKLIIGGFNKGDLPLDDSKTVTHHAYTLMHSSSKEALFTMRNPWGGNPNVDGSADGVLNIPDNDLIPPTIDLRIVDPGIAANFGEGVTEPYFPPVLKANEIQMRVAPYLLNPEKISR